MVNHLCRARCAPRCSGGSNPRFGPLRIRSANCSAIFGLSILLPQAKQVVKQRLGKVMHVVNLDRPVVLTHQLHFGVFTVVARKPRGHGPRPKPGVQLWPARRLDHVSVTQVFPVRLRKEHCMFKRRSEFGIFITPTRHCSIWNVRSCNHLRFALALAAKLNDRIADCRVVLRRPSKELSISFRRGCLGSHTRGLYSTLQRCVIFLQDVMLGSRDTKKVTNGSKTLI